MQNITINTITIVTIRARGVTMLGSNTLISEKENIHYDTLCDTTSVSTYSLTVVACIIPAALTYGSQVDTSISITLLHVY